MINSIHIQNFRCFHDTTIKRFGRINLFGGENNAGKTSLLEAIFVGLKENNIFDINKLRSTNLNYNNDYDSWFNESNVNKPIVIQLTFDKENQSFNTTIEMETDEFTDFPVVKKEYEGFELHETNTENKANKEKNLILWSPEIRNQVSFIFSKNRQYPIIDLKTSFEKTFKEGRKDLILNALHVIDKSIYEITPSSEDVFYFTKMGVKKPIPSIYFGDAVQKIFRYIITITDFHNEKEANTEGGRFLLIDEIENGLHYTVHENFWEMLFKIAIDNDIQIFATSHSSEMIASFGKVAQEYNEEGVYFEMLRHFKTNEIVANRVSPDTLEYKLEHNSPFRGERETV